jgi:hypothetical protein
MKEYSHQEAGFLLKMDRPFINRRFPRTLNTRPSILLSSFWKIVRELSLIQGKIFVI